MPPPDPEVNRENITIAYTPPSFTEAVQLYIRVHKPQSHKTSGSLPIGVFFHSGGFIINDVTTESNFCDNLSKSLPCIVVQGSYRKGPGHKHPAAFDDAVGVWDWVMGNVEMLGEDKGRIFVIGGAVGGTLALGLTARPVERQETRS